MIMMHNISKEFDSLRMEYAISGSIEYKVEVETGLIIYHISVNNKEYITGTIFLEQINKMFSLEHIRMMAKENLESNAEHPQTHPERR